MKARKEETLTRTLYIDGVSVIMVYPESISEKVHKQIEKFAKSGGLWFAGDWIELTATLNGERIAFINMSKFIGME